MNERQASAVTMNPIGTGGYDLMELRRKLELRMEYSKVATLPHDPTMDPNCSIPSYASSTDVADREAQLR